MAKLTPCKRCRRHCRVSEAACPFCGARRLAIGAGAIAFATLAVGWSGDAAADPTHDSGANPEAVSSDAEAPDADAAPSITDRERYGMQPISLYGVPPGPALRLLVIKD